MANPIFILDETEDGVVATHPARVELPVLAAPTAEEHRDKFFNTIRPSLMVIGCMKLTNQGFDFDSSFVGPKAMDRFTRFAELMRRLQAEDPTGGGRFPPISIFGHADPTGEPDYNKILSGRRARAVFGLLTRDVKLWETLFSNPFHGDDWGTRSIQAMLQNVGGGIPFYDGPIDGAVTPETKQRTREAIEAYQQARGVKPANGVAGASTRKVLFAEYMDAMCHFEDGTPFVLDPVEHFLCRGKDKGRRGDVHGCGEFNPVLLLSKDEEDRFAPAAVKKDPALKEERNAAYEKDRRALVFIFKHDTVMDPNKWPCPGATEGPSRCRERFWSDAKDRLRRDPDQEPPGPDGLPKGDGRRRFEKTGDTFACRWYHGFAQHSPCEAGRKLWVIRLRVDGPRGPQPLKQRAYVARAGETRYAPVLRGFTTDAGQAVVPVLDEPVSMKLKVDLFGVEQRKGEPQEGAGGGGFDADRFENEDRFVELTLDAGALEAMTEADLPAQQRLYNLGFGRGQPGTWSAEVFERAIRAFQRSRQLEVTGQLDDAQNTRRRLKLDHEVS